MRFALLFAAVFASIIAMAAPAFAETAAVEPTLLVNGDDGYGTSDCLADGGRCGAIVADALCRARGHASAASFRRAEPDEVTASAGSTKAAGALFVVLCKPAG